MKKPYQDFLELFHFMEQQVKQDRLPSSNELFVGKCNVGRHPNWTFHIIIRKDGSKRRTVTITTGDGVTQPINQLQLVQDTLFSDQYPDGFLTADEQSITKFREAVRETAPIPDVGQKEPTVWDYSVELHNVQCEIEALQNGGDDIEEQTDKLWTEFFDKYDALIKKTSKLFGGDDQRHVSLHDSRFHSISSRRQVHGYKISIRTYGFEFQSGKPEAYPEFLIEFESRSNCRELNGKTANHFVVDDDTLMMNYFKGYKTVSCFYPISNLKVTRL